MLWTKVASALEGLKRGCRFCWDQHFPYKCFPKYAFTSIGRYPQDRQKYSLSQKCISASFRHPNPSGHQKYFFKYGRSRQHLSSRSQDNNKIGLGHQTIWEDIFMIPATSPLVTLSLSLSCTSPSYSEFL